MTSYNLAVALGSHRVAAASARTDADAGVVAEPINLGQSTSAAADTAPSCVFVAAGGDLVFGDEAELRGRTEPERLICDLQHRLGDDVPLLVGGQRLAPEQLCAHLIAWVVERATAQLGEAPSGITIGYPAIEWGTHRLGLIANALAALDIDGFDFMSQPEAAIAQYEAAARLETGQTIAVYDLGGDGFSCTVLRKQRDGGFDQVGVPGGLSDLGGADFDDLVFRHVVGVSGLAKMGLDADDAQLRSALIRLREACATAKEELSSQTAVTIPVAVAATHTTVRLTRSEFEQMIEPALDRTIEVVEETLERAGIQVSQLEAVLLIGGSSRIPRVTQRLSESLDLPIVIDSDPAVTAVRGAARAGLPFAENRAAALIAAAADQLDDDAEPASDDQPVARPRRWGRRRARRIGLTAALVTLVTLLLTGSTSAAPNSVAGFIGGSSPSQPSLPRPQTPAAQPDLPPSAERLEPAEAPSQNESPGPGGVAGTETSDAAAGGTLSTAGIPTATTGQPSFGGGQEQIEEVTSGTTAPAPTAAPATTTEPTVDPPPADPPPEPTTLPTEAEGI